MIIGDWLIYGGIVLILAVIIGYLLLRRHDKKMKKRFEKEVIDNPENLNAPLENQKEVKHDADKEKDYEALNEIRRAFGRPEVRAKYGPTEIVRTIRSSSTGEQFIASTNSDDAARADVGQQSNFQPSSVDRTKKRFRFD